MVTATDVVQIGNGKDFVTFELWTFLSQRLESRMVPHNWPMRTLDEARYPYATRYERTDSLMVGLLEKYAHTAYELHEHANPSQVWFAGLDHTNDTILGIRPGIHGLRTITMIPNEQGGMTLAFAGEY